MVTIKEIASALGVSTATVSNVLNGKGRVSAERKEAILTYVEQHHYVPNEYARSLKVQNTTTIGIIAEDLTVFNCPSIVDGIHEYLEHYGYTYILGNLRLFKKYQNEFYHHERYASAVNQEFMIMQSKNVDGVIYIGGHNRVIHAIPEDFPVPIVVTYGRTERPEIPCVNYDDAGGAYLAVSKLLDMGHTKIGLVTGDMSSFHTCERLKGFRQALVERGIAFDESLIYHGAWDRDSGYRAASELCPKRVTAFFSMNDVMAAGIYDYALQHQISIGIDLAVIGFDNRDLCTVLSPELSTISLPLEEQGKKAAQIILSLISANTDESISHEIEIPCQYVGRKSANPN